MSSAYQLKPWTDVVTVHDDIAARHLDLSTYAANLWSVHTQQLGCPAVYLDPVRFFQSTYMTEALKSLLEEVMGVLSGSLGDRVLQLRTPFGGGKTHALIALYHLANSPVKSRRTLASIADVKDAYGETISTKDWIKRVPDSGAVRVAVLHGVELDPTVGRQVDGGPRLHSLWGELAWQIGGDEAYALVRAQDESRTAPGAEVLRQVLERGPTLVLLDEVLVYVEKAMSLPLKDSTMGRQVLIFLQALTEVTRGLPKAATIYSLQASVHEAVGDESLLSTLDKLVSRIDAKREPVTGDEVMRVVQRRLFKDLGDPEVREAAAREYAGLFRKFREGGAETERERKDAEGAAEALHQRILTSYPFHPDILDLMYHRWGSVPSYQRTRGALQFLACTVAALQDQPRGAQPLIGPGDVPLADGRVRGTLFSQVGEREHFTSVLDADITGPRGRAKEVDRRMARESHALEGLRVGTRVSSAAFLYSFGARRGEERGVIEEELLASCLAPGLDRIVLSATLADLKESLLHLHHLARRYRFDTQPNLNKLVSDECKRWKPEEVADRVRDELWSRLKASKGVVLWPGTLDDVPDREPEFKIVYLDPDWSAKEEEQVKTELRYWTENRGGGKREYRNGLAFAVPNKKMSDADRTATRTLMGIESLLAQRAKLQLTPEQVDDLKERKTATETELDTVVRKLYGALWLPVADKQAPSGYRLQSVDPHTQVVPGRNIHEILIEALRTWVAGALTPQKVIALSRLGQVGDQGVAIEFVACEDLLKWLFAYLDFPKVKDPIALQRAISLGVEKLLFGYVPSARVENGTLMVDVPGLVLFGRGVDPGELDLGTGAYLLTPKQVDRLSGRIPGIPPSTSSPATSQSLLSDGGVSLPGEVASPPGRSGTDYTLRVEAEGAKVFKALEILPPLAEKSTRLRVVMEVHAESREGFDPVWLRNAVEEPLNEANVKKESTVRKGEI